MSTQFSRLPYWTIASVVFLTSICFGQSAPENLFLPGPQLDEIDGQIKGEISLFERYVQQQQWAEAVDIVRKLTDIGGDQLVFADEQFVGFSRGIRLSDHMQIGLSVHRRNETGLLEEFRNRTDAHARRLYVSAVHNRDAEQFKQIVNDYFAGSFGDEALLMLGEIELAQGNYDAARRVWCQLHSQLNIDFAQAKSDKMQHAVWGIQESKATPSTPENNTETNKEIKWVQLLAHPNSDIPLHEVLARLVFISILEGNLPRAKAELDLLTRRHPNSKGRLGGRTVDLSTELNVLISTIKLRELKIDETWPTFGGNKRRHPKLETPIHISRIEPLWRTRVPGPDRIIPPSDHSSFLSPTTSRLHPIVFDDTVFVATATAVYGFQASNGKPVTWADAETGAIYSIDTHEDEYSLTHDPIETTLTVNDSVLYAQLGRPKTRDFNSTQRIVGIDLKSEGRLAFNPILPEDDSWKFNGCPIVDEERFYVAKSKSSGVNELYVSCYENDLEVWRRKFGSSESLIESSTTLITLNEETIYVNSNHGFVAALDMRDGRIRWMVRYPRTKLSPKNLIGQAWYRGRQPNPCVLFDGMLFVAPSDHDGIFSIHAQTGQVLWRTDFLPGSFDATEILGVSDDRLIVSGRRLWWLDRFTGKLVGSMFENPFPRSGLSSMKGFGRGLLIGPSVFWPTQSRVDQIFMFDASTGDRRRQPFNLSAVNVRAGNLFVANDRLLVASDSEIVAFEVE